MITVRTYRGDPVKFPGQYLDGVSIYNAADALDALSKACGYFYERTKDEPAVVYCTENRHRNRPSDVQYWMKDLFERGGYKKIEDPRLKANKWSCAPLRGDIRRWVKTEEAVINPCGEITLSGFSRPENNGPHTVTKVEAPPPLGRQMARVVELDMADNLKTTVVKGDKGTIVTEEVGEASPYVPEGRSFPFRPVNRPNRLTVAMDFTSIGVGLKIYGTMPFLRGDELHTGGHVTRNVRYPSHPLGTVTTMKLTFELRECYSGTAWLCVLEWPSATVLDYIPGYRSVEG